MLLWALWKAGPSDVGAKLFAQWSDDCRLLQAEPFGLLLLDSDWWKDVAWELELLVRLHRVLPVRSLRLSMVKLGFDPGLSPATAQPGLQKLGLLVDEVECAVQPGHASSILRACEVFAGHRGQWLKVAGQEKAEVLERGLQGRAPRAWELALEFGAFVGYTAVRLGRALAPRRCRPGVASLEVNPLHACIARHLLDLGGLACVAEVKPGQAKDALPLVGEEAGGQSVGFSFMDHRGTIFHQDSALLLSTGLLAGGPRLVTDNTLNPGAPVFLWERRSLHSGAWPAETTPWSLLEFLSEHEDWTAVTDLRLRGRPGPVPRRPRPPSGNRP